MNRDTSSGVKSRIHGIRKKNQYVAKITIIAKLNTKSRSICSNL